MRHSNYAKRSILRNRWFQLKAECIRNGIWRYLVFLLFTGIINIAVADPEIEINGLDEPLEKNVRAYLFLQEEQCDADRWKIENLVKSSPEHIRYALKALGYYQPEIKYKLTWEDDCWQVIYDIDPGAPVRLNNIDLIISGPGATESFFIELLNNSGLKQGEILDHSLYERFKKELLAVADEKGYFDRNFITKVLAVDPEEKQANIDIQFATGERYYIGEITFKQSILDPEFVARYLKIESNQPYERSKIVKTQQALDGSGYFRQVQVKYREKKAENFHAPLEVELEALPPHKLALGAGYDTDLGVRGNAEYTLRYINRDGHRFNTQLSGSQRRSFLFLDYMIPLANPAKERLNFTSGFVYEDVENVQSLTFSLGVRWMQQFLENHLFTQKLDFVAERFDTGSGNDKFKILIVPGVILSNIKAEKRDIFVDGYRYFLDLQGASRYLLSGVNFIQGTIKLKGAHSFSWGGRIIARTDLGATAVDTFADLPASYRFYTGGDNTVRGYAFRSISPVDPLGNLIGGRYLAVASIEYEQKILKQWSLAVFADAGDAFNNQLDLKYGVGFGVRWYTLFAPIKVDVAFPSEDWTDVRFHFSISAAL